jgi:hypothetical protein
MNPPRWTLRLVTVGLLLLLFSSWMLQITLPRRPPEPHPLRIGARKIARTAPAPRPLGRDKRSESGHEATNVAWISHDLAGRDAAS